MSPPMDANLQEKLLSLLRPMIEDNLLPILRDPNTRYSFEREDERTNVLMQKLGFTEDEEIFAELRDLQLENYSSGPEQNDSPYSPKLFRDGEVWFFGKYINDKLARPLEVYIKICTAKLNSEDFVACVSFHEPEFVIRYPFAN